MLANQALDAHYGLGGLGFANDEPDALVRFVSLFRSDHHVVYVTRGVSTASFPNEIALRIRHAAATAEQPLIEVAPIWPVQLLV